MLTGCGCSIRPNKRKENAKAEGDTTGRILGYQIMGFQPRGAYRSFVQQPANPDLYGCNHVKSWSPALEPLSLHITLSENRPSFKVCLAVVHRKCYGEIKFEVRCLIASMASRSSRRLRGPSLSYPHVGTVGAELAILLGGGGHERSGGGSPSGVSPRWCLAYTSRTGSYARVSLGEDSERWVLWDCCVLLSACVCAPVVAIPEIMLPSAKRSI